MIHDSTWLGSMRAKRWTRLTVPVGFLLACVLFAALPAAASADVEMRGEWKLTLTSSALSTEGTALFTTEANGKGEFTSTKALFREIFPATFSGTLEGSTATVALVAPAFGPAPEIKFTSSTMKVESGVGSLSISGTGTLTAGSEPPESATLVATRIRTYRQIEEQEERETREREEKEARAKVRGEWAITLEGAQTVKGVALIAQAANSSNEFAASNALFEGFIPGTFSGTLEGKEASVTITTQAVGPVPAGSFTGTKLTVTSTGTSMSIAGAGTLTLGEATLPGTMTATRIKTYTEVVEQETAEREAKEKQEKEAQEAKEKAEKEAAEKAAREAKAAQEAREKQEKEAVKPPIVGGTTVPVPSPLVSALTTTKSATAGGTGSIVLALENPNSYAVQGHLALTFTRAGKASSAHKASKKQIVSLGSASFSLSGHGSGSVKLKLSSSARSELTHHKTLHVVISITTQASGQTTTTKTLSLTLHAAKTAHGKH
jgi:hypothetical protein